MNKNLIIGILVIVVAVGGVYLLTNKTATTGEADIATTTPTTSTQDTESVDTAINSDISGATKPVAVTSPSVAATDTTAVVTGIVKANGSLTSYWYEYGVTVGLGNRTTEQTIGYGYTNIPAPGYITGLASDTTYYFRLLAGNEFGTSPGPQYAFHTTLNVPPPAGSTPSAKTLSSSGISRTSANLRGEVTPNKASTQYWFEYGKNGNLGNTTGLTSVGNGTGSVSASAGVSNLDPATTYYYRVNAQNQFGTVNGAILTFKTSGPAASVAPVVTTQVAGPVAKNSSTLRGTVNPSGTQTTYWFEYSSDSLLGSVLLKTTTKKSAGSGAETVSIEANISGLQSETTYFYRAVAQNSAGIIRGSRDSFTTN